MAGLTALNVLSVGLAAGLVVGFTPLTSAVDVYVHDRQYSALVVAATALALFALGTYEHLLTALAFAWNCFLKPIGKTATQAQRLDRFYEGQADSKSILLAQTE